MSRNNIFITAFVLALLFIMPSVTHAASFSFSPNSGHLNETLSDGSLTCTVPNDQIIVLYEPTGTPWAYGNCDYWLPFLPDSVSDMIGPAIGEYRAIAYIADLPAATGENYFIDKANTEVTEQDFGKVFTVLGNTDSIIANANSGFTSAYDFQLSDAVTYMASLVVYFLGFGFGILVYLLPYIIGLAVIAAIVFRH